MTEQEIETIKKVNEEFIYETLSKKYLHDGESSWEDICIRIDKTINIFREKFAKSKKHKYINSNLFNQDLLYNAMVNKRFIPAGSILYGFSPEDKNLSLSNCYYIPIEEDSIEGIGSAITNTMRTYSYRGGVGLSLETLRPKGSRVNNASKTSTGSVSFMPLFSQATQIIGQKGRRGAQMLSHHINHPDIVDFIKCKSSPNEVFEKDPLRPDFIPDISGANTSVKITDDFMRAVQEDKEWIMQYIVNNEVIQKKISAKELFKIIARSAWEYAEPGVLLWDTVLEDTPMAVFEELKPKGVNPCGEQILGDWQSCNLGSMFLHNYILKPYTAEADFNWSLFLMDIEQAVIFMNLIIDVNNHPLQKQNMVDRYGRKIGLGISGLGDCFAMMNLTYGSKKSLEFIKKVMIFKSYVEVNMSYNLAKKTNLVAEVFESSLKESKDKFFRHKHWKKIFDNKEVIDPFITRNSDVTYIDYDTFINDQILANVGLSTIAPNGTISIIANNCTSGLEPLYAFRYTRKSRIMDKTVEVVHPVLFDYLYHNAKNDLLTLSDKVILKKYNYIESADIPYMDRISVQSELQMYITDSISSTINLPKETTIEDMEKIYMSAWRHRLKGVTIYRNGCNLGGILDAKDTKPVVIEPAKLNDVEKAFRHKALWKRKVKTYITVTVDENNVPLELFAKMPKEAGYENDTTHIYDSVIYLERQAYWDSICRLSSYILRMGRPVGDIIKQLEKSSYNMHDLPALLTRIMYKYNVIDMSSITYTTCPECGKKKFFRTNGCNKCAECGYSTCG